LRDPAPIADFIEKSVMEKKSVPPDFVGGKFTKTSYYGVASRYENFPSEETFVTLRGPLFTGCYDRYQIELANVEGATTIIAPKTPAPGNPWVFRADFVDQDDVVDQALLAKGFYIVTGAVPYNFDGPVVAQWNLIYQHLTAHGFSTKPVLAGAGGAAGEAYAWAIENPEKVSCIYAENPSMHSNLAKIQPLENLEPLAKAGIPVLHVCGSSDPLFEKSTRMAEERYQKLGGKIKVIVEPGKGHYPLTPNDPKAAIDFITAAAH
jgi:pimeloyl-ACP methyl ester carboxylesterase